MTNTSIVLQSEINLTNNYLQIITVQVPVRSHVIAVNARSKK